MKLLKLCVATALCMTATLACAAAPPADLKGTYTTFGVSSDVFTSAVKRGEAENLEGGVNYFKTHDGQVWFSHFEADLRPLDERLVYLVRISADKTKGCGEALPNFQPAPAQCVVEEKTLSWSDAKKFLRGKIKDGNRFLGYLETAYRARTPRK